MGFDIYRNIQLETLAKTLEEGNTESPAPTKDKLTPIKRLAKATGMPIDISIDPPKMQRAGSTLQRGEVHVHRANWKYDQGNLYLAVTCNRKWAPADITKQRCAIVVAVSHQSDNINLYVPLREHTRIYQRARVRI
jgi:hypothetical protein